MAGSGSFLGGLQDTKQLATLDLSGTNISNEDLTALNKVSSLRTLDLRRTKLTDLSVLKVMEGILNTVYIPAELKDKCPFDRKEICVAQ